MTEHEGHSVPNGQWIIIKIIICLISEPDLHTGGATFAELSSGARWIQAQCCREKTESSDQRFEGDLRHFGLLHGFSSTDLEPERRARGEIKATRRV